MSLACVLSRAQTGMQAPLVRVEVDISGGLPALSIVGLPETEVKESKDRVRAAIKNSGYEFPSRRITISLAPADLPKEGGRFDLAVALGILAATGQVPAESLADLEFIGELSLAGELRPVRGSLPSALGCAQDNRKLVVPMDNGAEAALAGPECVYVAPSLTQICASLNGAAPLQAARAPELASETVPDISDVRGQHQAKRALEIAAAGGHSLLMSGPPGSGKSMLAARLPGLLPPMTQTEAIEAASVASISLGGFDPARHWGVRPFRAPHHTASGVALVGGGPTPRPGEITLAHHGVLFLDELPEFERKVLEVLREPLESGKITISRAARQAEFPARFQLIAAMNPCPCGYLGDESGRCHCSADRVTRYLGRISGPLLDRIDMRLNVARVDRDVLTQAQPTDAEHSAAVRERVVAARRFAREHGRGQPNASLNTAGVNQFCRLDESALTVLNQAMDRLSLSARAHSRILKLARSIADLAQAEDIGVAHVAEAISYRE